MGSRSIVPIPSAERSIVLLFELFIMLFPLTVIGEGLNYLSFISIFLLNQK
jgi:hypothetical protein